MEAQLNFLSNKSCAKHKISIFVDGASRNNPGPAGVGIYVKHDNKELIKIGYFLGEKTNNQAEYLALILGLFLTQKKTSYKKSKNISLSIYSDSELLVKQITGNYKIKNPLLAKLKKIVDIFLAEQKYDIHHILRDKNKIADKLANQGIDSRKKLPISFIKLLTDNNVEL